MGRYYSGDIEGKFWFAVQSSNDADNFGVTGLPPDDRINYYFKKSDMPLIEEGLKLCVDTLKEFGSNIIELLDSHHFSDKDMSEEWLRITDEPQPKATHVPNCYEGESMRTGTLRETLTYNSIIVTDAQMSEIDKTYARLILGRKIHKCVTDKEECFFEAEL
tara:strand:- start:64 stop:549 length:486 start_codon:yes stop_codon:yes gene_type:complete